MTDLASNSVPIDGWKDSSQLIMAVAAQDQNALQTLYYQYRRSIFAVAYVITRDYHLAEDILQDTIIQIWENASRYQQGSNSSAWIHAIARNRSLDMIRQRNHIISTEVFEDQIIPDQLIVRENPDDHIMLVSGLIRLKHEQAIVFVLKAIVGLSHLEISNMLNIPYRMVRYRYHQAISMLQKYLSYSDESSNRMERLK